MALGLRGWDGVKDLISISSDGPGLFVQGGLPDRKTERVFDVDERLAFLERDWILVVLILVGGVAR
jgi:hypothetical protein